MTRERLAKELEKVQEQIKELQKKEKRLQEEKDAADLAASRSIVEKKKISPEVLQIICGMKEDEIKHLLEMRKKEENENKTEEKNQIKSN